MYAIVSLLIIIINQVSDTLQKTPFDARTAVLYKMEVDQYKKAMVDEIAANYKKVSRAEMETTNGEAARLVSKLEIEDRVDVFSESEPFILIKDHKEGFPGRVKNRLVNPAKSNVCSGPTLRRWLIGSRD